MYSFHATNDENTQHFVWLKRQANIGEHTVDTFLEHHRS